MKEPTLEQMRSAAETLLQGTPVKFHPNTACTFAPEFQALARTFLAEHPADDAATADDNWLQSVGFERNIAGGYERLIRVDQWLVVRDAIYIDAGRHQIPLTCHRTRGVVRRFCAALGITLNEGR